MTLKDVILWLLENGYLHFTVKPFLVSSATIELVPDKKLYEFLSFNQIRYRVFVIRDDVTEEVMYHKINIKVQL